MSAMEESYEYSIETFEDCLRTGYIDSSLKSDSRFSPQFVANDTTMGTNLLSVIKQQLSSCQEFFFSVAFIASGGLQTLIETLNYLRDKNIPGKLLTSSYLNFNDPDALRKLLEYPNIEVRVYQGNMHTKGYFFNKGDLSTVIIGSSNLTQTALTCNKEWNVLFHSYKSGEMFKSAEAEFSKLWHDRETTLLSPAWIDQYQEYRAIDNRQSKKRNRPSFKESSTAEFRNNSKKAITPNKMQTHALEALSVLHSRGEKRALLISATGTGKTYLSALDVQQTKPKRVLFIAHRMRILEASLKSFQTVLGESFTYELYSTGKTPNASCVFAMVSSLSRHLTDFKPEDFDYIIIDEAHRTGANSYQAILDYFKPKFILGMTATPSRTDGYDVYSLFNHVIAFRITLQDALANEMLAPFHYFGIADFEIDDESIDDPALFSKLASSERARHIMQKIEEYSIGHERRGLIFCNRNDEAEELSRLFNSNGYRTTALSGANSDDSRNRAIQKLEANELEYIFSVDIFNEGIDIPSINQIIMLRRTESPIVFVQQLGRGLRKTEDKEYTLVLDFIGNYQQNYLVPIALSGDRTYNKDNLRVFVKEGSTIIPGASTISFDPISENRIFKAVDSAKFGETRLIKNEYQHLKNVLGRIPTLIDFDKNDSLDPLIIFRKFGSYAEFLIRYESEYEERFSENQIKMLKFVSQKLGNGKRREELALLRDLIVKHLNINTPTATETNRISPITITKASVKTRESAINVLAGKFSSDTIPLIEQSEKGWTISDELALALDVAEFRKQILETIKFGLKRNNELYSNLYKETNFVLNAKYTYEEVCRLLNWEKNVNGQNIGGYKYDEKTNTFPVFINYDKDPDIDASINYEDRFISNRELIAISKQPRYLTSPEILRLKDYPANQMKTYLFVRKDKNDGDGGKEFYFLGEIMPTGQYAEITMPGTTKAAVEIGYRLDSPVRGDIYDYLTSSLEN